MSSKKLLPKFEVLIILVFLLSFMIWAISRCNATKRQYQEETAEATADPTTGEQLADSLSGQYPADSLRAAEPDGKRYTTLYVTIDGLKLRNEPSLNGNVLHTLRLFEEVTFLEEVTDFTTEISLGKAMADEPWIKVRSRKGHIGWVYGAGVHYYKMKHPGAE